jgi:hypothetical protein
MSSLRNPWNPPHTRVEQILGITTWLEYCTVYIMKTALVENITIFISPLKEQISDIMTESLELMGGRKRSKEPKV